MHLWGSIPQPYEFAPGTWQYIRIRYAHRKVHKIKISIIDWWALVSIFVITAMRRSQKCIYWPLKTIYGRRIDREWQTKNQNLKRRMRILNQDICNEKKILRHPHTCDKSGGQRKWKNWEEFLKVDIWSNNFFSQHIHSKAKYI